MKGIKIMQNKPLAQIYIPCQEFTTPVTPAQGLQMGTIWSELYMPYKGDKKQ